MDAALILGLGDQASPSRLGALLARHFDCHPADAMARARYGGGILVECGAPEKVQYLQTRLREEGVETRILPSSALGECPRGFRVVTLDFRDEAILARQVGGRTLALLRGDIPGVHLYGLRPDGAPSGAPEAAAGATEMGPVLGALGVAGAGRTLSPRGRQLVKNLEEAGLLAMEFHLTLCCREPTGFVRLEKDWIDYSSRGAGKLEHSLDNFLLLLDEVVAYLPDAWNRQPAVDFLADLDPRRILRSKREEVVNFERWMFQWARLEELSNGESWRQESSQAPAEEESDP